MSLQINYLEQPRSRLVNFIVMSMALHLLLLATAKYKPHTHTKREPIPIKIVAQPQLQQEARKQIVTPPKITEIAPPKEDTRFLTDQDTSTKVERVKRGDSPDAGLVVGESTEAKKESKPLDLSPSVDLLKNLDPSEIGKEPPQLQAGTAAARPFSRAAGAGARFLGLNGSVDFLPEIKDGDITLLNAKADKFAVFVRRVAIRVFNEIKQEGWQYLRAVDLQSLRGYATVRAVLAPDGSLMRVVIEESSGLPGFDRVLEQSAKQGAADPHPPPQAVAADGNFHFIFQAKSWAQIYGDPRRGGVSERRWLILRTGLR